MLKFLKSAGWSSLATIFNVVAAMVSGKIFSIYFGPPGIALQAFVQSLISITNSIPNEGVNRGLIKYLSGKNMQDREAQGYIKGAVILNTIFVLFSFPLSYFLLKSADNSPQFLETNNFFLILCLATILQIVTLFLFSILLSGQHLKWYALISGINNGIGLILIFVGANNGLDYALVGLIFAPCSALGFLIVVLSKKINWSFLLKGKLNHLSIIKELSHFVLIAVSIIAFGKIVDFFVRVFIIDRYDLYYTGLWQSSVKVSDGYSTLFTGVYGAMFFPKLAALINNKESINHYVQKSALPTLALILAGAIGVYIFRELILEILFDKSFRVAEQFLTFQIIGDCFKFASWFLVYIILAQVRTSIYVFLQIFSAIIYILLIIFFTQDFGIMSVAYAHVLRNILYFIVLFIINKKYLL